MSGMIPEIEAREVLSTYEGSNNQLLEYKRRQSYRWGNNEAET